jgi:hypothetical protein
VQLVGLVLSDDRIDQIAGLAGHCDQGNPLITISQVPTHVPVADHRYGPFCMRHSVTSVLVGMLVWLLQLSSDQPGCCSRVCLSPHVLQQAFSSIRLTSVCSQVAHPCSWLKCHHHSLFSVDRLTDDVLAGVLSFVHTDRKPSQSLEAQLRV